MLGTNSVQKYSNYETVLKPSTCLFELLRNNLITLNGEIWRQELKYIVELE